MRLKVIPLKFAAGHPIAILHQHTAQILSVYVSERVRIRKKHSIVAVVDIAEGILKEDEIALSSEAIKSLNIKQGDAVEVTEEIPPRTTHFILEKLQGKELSYEKLLMLSGDIVHNTLTEAELAFFVSGVYIHGMSNNEVANMIRAMVKFGKKLSINDSYDKHCIGGIAGNRTTPIVVSICAAAGVKMPKTSSRAITSAAGTADAMECLTNVEFSTDRIKNIIDKTGACLVWGGALGLAPADDKIIKVERHLALDPKSQLIASILAKKLAIGSRGILIDIPYGFSAKVKTRREARKLARRFKKVAKMLNLRLKVALTDGSQPIGNGIGPVLEARDVLKVLRQEPDRPLDLEKKSLFLSSVILKMAGKKESAEEILKSRKAYGKFKEIIEAQGGSLNDTYMRLQLGKFSYDVKSEKHGNVISINNKKIASIARAAGCPADKASGVYLHKHVNGEVSPGDKLLTIYSNTKEELVYARKLYGEIRPVAY